MSKSGILSSIFSINIPYPRVGSFMSTCVTAPMMRPFWIIGLPDMPCIIPPVFSSRAGSVTVMVKHLFESDPVFIAEISTVYLLTLFVSSVHQI